MSYDELIKEIFSSSLRIRYAAVLDATGSVIAGGMREGVEPLASESDGKRFHSDVVLFRHVREEWNRFFGRVRFNLSSRERLNLISFYLDGDTLLITTEPDVSLLIINRIMDILRKHRLINDK